MAYERTLSECRTDGLDYENKMMELLCIRCRNKRYKFNVGSNVAAADKFDDIVLHYYDDTRSHTILMQLKHKLKDNSNISNIFSEVKKKKIFPIVEYFKSFCQVKKLCEEKADLEWWGNFENFQFVFFTNAQVNDTEYFEKLPIDESDIIATGECAFKLCCTNKVVEKLKENKSFKNLNDNLFDEFLQKFVLYVGQSSEGKLNKAIDKEIADHSYLSTLGAKKIRENILANIRHLKKIKSNHALTENNFTYVPGKEILNSLNKKYEPGIETSFIKYERKFPEKFVQDLGSSKSTIHVIESPAPVLCCLKLKQALRNTEEHPILIDSQTLDKEAKTILLVWPSKICGTLIVEDRTKNDETLFRRFTEKLLELSNITASSIKIIVVSENKELLKEKRLKCKKISMTVCFQDFTEVSKIEFCKKKINFQGFPIELGKLITEEVFDTLNDSSLTCLLSKCDNPIGGKIQLNGYHIRRTVTHPIYIKSSIFVNNSDHILAVSGEFEFGKLLEKAKVYESNHYPLVASSDGIISIPPMIPVNIKVDKSPLPMKKLNINIEWKVENTLQRLQEMAGAQNSVGRSSSTKCLVNHKDKIRKINTEEEFEDLCKRHSNVHWLEVTKDILIWKRSYGDMALILSHLENFANLCPVNTVMDLPGKIVLVSSPPGMGKSTLLSQIAFNTKKDDPTTWIIKVNLQETTHVLDKIDVRKINDSIITDFLFATHDASEDNVHWRKIYDKLLKCYKNTVILIDGFDEILPKYESKTICLLQAIKKLNVRKIWLTTRPVVKLEQKLQTIPCYINPFTIDDRKKFFVEYWKKKMHIDKFMQLLDLADTVSKMFSNTSFLGNPLHCEMMAEAYEEIIRKHIESNSKDVIEKIEELQLYKKFVDKKFWIYCERHHIDKVNLEAEYVIEEKKESFEDGHIHSSFIEILTNAEQKRIKPEINATKFLQKLKSGKEKTGLITLFRDGKPHFVHRMFAEYFAAKFLFQNVAKNFDFIKDIMFISERRFAGVRHILNLFLFRNLPLYRAIMSYDLNNVKYLLHESQGIKRDKLGRNPLHVAVQYISHAIANPKHGSLYQQSICILKELLDSGVDINATDKFTGKVPLHYFLYNLSFFSWIPISMFLERKNIDENDVKNFIEVIHLNPNMLYQGIIFAAQHRNIMLLTLLTKNYSRKKKRNMQVENILRQCLEDSVSHGNPDIVQCIKEVLQNK